MFFHKLERTATSETLGKRATLLHAKHEDIGVTNDRFLLKNPFLNKQVVLL